MDSRLESIFRTTFRTTEATDTRLGIGREEQKDEGRKKRDKEEKPDEQDLWQDRTMVSVAALRLFLEGLVAGPASASVGSVVETSLPPDQSGEALAPAAGSAAAAAQAYAATARGGRPPVPPAAQAAGGGSDAGPELGLDEIRVIHKLVGQLAQLSERGVAALEIRRSDSFLQSLVNAVESSL